MSDFLADLIGRAEQRSPILARRQRALFEPVTMWRGPAPSGRAGMLEEVSEEEAANLPPRERAAGPTHLPRVEAEESSERRREGIPVLDPARRAEGRRRAPHPAPETEPSPAERAAPEVTRPAIPAAPRRRATEDHPASPVPETPANRPAARVASTVVTGAIVPSHSPPFAKPMVEERRVHPPSAAREDRLTSPPRPVEKPRETAAEARAVPKPAAVPGIERAVALARAAQPKVSAATPESAPPGPPPVQITIGRVEVRALPPGESRPPRDAKPAVPKLSLEEYLRERSTGGR